jgi:hypothetical protein
MQRGTARARLWPHDVVGKLSELCGNEISKLTEAAEKIRAVFVDIPGIAEGWLYRSGRMTSSRPEIFTRY